MVGIKLKWGKQVFDNIEIDPNTLTVAELKKKCLELTNVPLDRQKLMSKDIWKGMLKDTEDLKSFAPKFKDGSQIMLMGSAEVVQVPEKEAVFLEDMTTKELAETGAHIPAGLSNLGNTCYMNATLQCLRYIPEFRDALALHQRTNGSDLANSLTAHLGDTFVNMDSNTTSFACYGFVDTLRRAFPQFAQQSLKGGYMQQDSDEFQSTLFNTLAQQLHKGKGEYANIPQGSNMIDALFGVELEETLTCSETDMEPASMKQDKAFKLVCNITKDINHLSEGIKLGLEGTIEKNSDVLGRNAVWKKSMRVSKLPKYLCVQFMRFYWKLTPESADHTGVKCKMLRPISFPTTLDVYEFCSEKLKASLKIWRDKHAEEMLNEFKKDKEDAKTEEKQDVEMEEIAPEDKAALDAAKAMSLGQDVMSPGIGLPSEFKGNYELFAVVTHKGRSADSGHYIGWVRDKEDNWFCYDDDEVSPCKTEDIQRLKGGGDWHMTYVTFYRAKN